MKINNKEVESFYYHDRSFDILSAESFGEKLHDFNKDFFEKELPDQLKKIFPWQPKYIIFDKEKYDLTKKLPPVTIIALFHSDPINDSNYKSCLCVIWLQEKGQDFMKKAEEVLESIDWNNVAEDYMP